MGFVCKVAVALSATSVASCSALAEVLRVPAEFPTIQAAIDSSSRGDSILVAPGVYPEAIVIDVPGVSVLSESLGEARLIEQGPVIEIAADSVTIRGFVSENIAMVTGATALLAHGDEFRIEFCSFLKGKPCVTIVSNGSLLDCLVSLGDGGVQIREAPEVLFENCRIVSNGSGDQPDDGGVAIYQSLTGVSPVVRFVGCQFADNHAQFGGGALSIDGSLGIAFPQVTIERCIFFENSAQAGAAIYSVNGELAIRGSTFAENTASEGGFGAATITLDDNIPQDVSLENCIVAFNSAPAVACFKAASPSLRCNDVFGNDDDTLCGVILEGNISEDPLFCNPAVNDFALQHDSPCAPDQSQECGLIGALPPLCTSPVEDSTWGRVKGRFLGREVAK